MGEECRELKREGVGWCHLLRREDKGWGVKERGGGGERLGGGKVRTELQKERGR